MTYLLFRPVEKSLPNPVLIYDPAFGSGGMLAEAQNLILHPETGIAPEIGVHLYGKEINGETYAICKSDMLIQWNDAHLRIATDPEFEALRNPTS